MEDALVSSAGNEPQIRKSRCTVSISGGNRHINLRPISSKESGLNPKVLDFGCDWTAMSTCGLWCHGFDGARPWLQQFCSWPSSFGGFRSLFNSFAFLILSITGQ